MFTGVTPNKDPSTIRQAVLGVVQAAEGPGYSYGGPVKSKS